MSSTNNSNGEVATENGEIQPRYKTITDDMPQWQKEKFHRYNEELKLKVQHLQERIRREEEREQSKWADLPIWKATLMKRREEEKKKREYEEEQDRIREQRERAEWEALPPWRRDIYKRKGLKPGSQRPDITSQSTANNHVTRAESTPEDNNNYAEMTNEQGDDEGLYSDNEVQVQITQADKDALGSDAEGDDQVFEVTQEQSIEENGNVINDDCDDDDDDDDDGNEDQTTADNDDDNIANVVQENGETTEADEDKQHEEQSMDVTITQES